MRHPVRHRGARYPVLVIGSLILGLGIGAVVRTMPPGVGIAALVDAAEVIGTMWVNAIRMTVIPLIMSLLIGAVAGARSGSEAGRLGMATIGAFILLVATLAVAAALAAPLLVSGLNIDADLTAALRASIAGTAVPTGDAGIGAWLRPGNGFYPVSHRRN